MPTCSLANLAALLALRPGQRSWSRRRPLIDERVARRLGASQASTSRSTRGRRGSSRSRLDARSAVGRRAALPREHAHARAAARSRPRADRGARRRGAAHAHASISTARGSPNAAVALGVPLAALAAPVDTVALSLNKGLCAPFGAMLAGDAETIAAARAAPEAPRRRDGPQGRDRRRRGAPRARPGPPARRRPPPRARAGRPDRRRREPRDEHRLTRTSASRRCRELERRGVLALAPDGRRVRFVTHAGSATPTSPRRRRRSSRPRAPDPSSRLTTAQHGYLPHMAPNGRAILRLPLLLAAALVLLVASDAGGCKRSGTDRRGRDRAARLAEREPRALLADRQLAPPADPERDAPPGLARARLARVVARWAAGLPHRRPRRAATRPPSPTSTSTSSSSMPVQAGVCGG